MTPSEMLQRDRSEIRRLNETTEKLREIAANTRDLIAALLRRDAAREALDATHGTRAKADATMIYLVADKRVRDLTPSFPKEYTPQPECDFEWDELGYETVPAPIYSEDEAADLRQRGRDLRAEMDRLEGGE